MTRAALPEARRASHRRFVDPDSGELIDSGLLLAFRAPHSFTGEDVAELHHHGSAAVLDRLASLFAQMPALRAAEPGEFSKRAFLNGRLDLSEAEAIADLVDATTEAQARQALRQLEGAAGEQVAAWRDTLLSALAQTEAEIDFAAEEGDVADGVSEQMLLDVAELAAALARAEQQGERGERLRRGVTVAIVGAPNAGKSSLLNLLAARDVAIVTPVPGTTRDVIEVTLELDGVPVTLLDTAGLRESTDPVEREGVRRTRARADAADLVLLLRAVGEVDAPPLARAPDVTVINKIDLAADGASWRDAVLISCLNGQGIEPLIALLARRAAELSLAEGDAVFARARQREALTGAREALQRCLQGPREIALVAEELRLAMRALGRIVGSHDVEDVLDRVFSSFCIGK